MTVTRTPHDPALIEGLMRAYDRAVCTSTLPDAPIVAVLERLLDLGWTPRIEGDDGMTDAERQACLDEWRATVCARPSAEEIASLRGRCQP